MSATVEFLKIQYQIGKVTADQVQSLVLKGKITQQEADIIKGV